MHELTLVSLMSEATRPAHAAIAALLAAGLSVRVGFVEGQPWQAQLGMLDAGEAQLAFMCGLPYVRRAARLVPLAAPVQAGERYAGRPVYFSDVVVQHASAYTRFDELGKAEFVNPNLDVAYLEAWLAVDAQTPAILEVPRVEGRYYTAQIVDEWAEILYNINERTFPAHPYGAFAFCLRGSDPAIPAGALRLDLPSRKAKLLARVERKGDDAARWRCNAPSGSSPPGRR